MLRHEDHHASVTLDRELGINPLSLVLGLEGLGERMMQIDANHWHFWNFQRKAMKVRVEVVVGRL